MIKILNLIMKINSLLKQKKKKRLVNTLATVLDFKLDLLKDEAKDEGEKPNNIKSPNSPKQNIKTSKISSKSNNNKKNNNKKNNNKNDDNKNNKKTKTNVIAKLKFWGKITFFFRSICACCIINYFKRIT